jgi:hypothetical protein
MIGNMLRDRESQYIATKDEGTQTWRILDTWHDILRDMNPDDDVEDDSPAVTVLTEGGFIALVKEASRLGVLQNATTPFGITDTSQLENIRYPKHGKEIAEMDEELTEMRKKIVKYEEEISTLRLSVSKSEGTVLKEKAMETLLKLTLSSDIEKLTTCKD